ncbi:larval cuticle protein 9 [Drosophila hydei]|uniref:Larval cuticle protein 9 n=1 Tax=Drosophila hydei TaxID=7224 RepID=A0A6J1L7V4_DROHY|nr:larval cuticle protein 9 [Drosophila hydei]
MLNHKFLNGAWLLLLVLLCTYLAAADEEPTLIKLVNQQNLDGAGQYNHEIEVDNGIHSLAKGNVNRVEGEYFLLNEKGKPPIRVTYTADATGFHPHIN